MKSKYEAKCLKARSEREIDTYAILMADPDSYTYKQAVHAEKEQDLRRACDEGMIKIRQAKTQENMEAYWLTKKNFTEWQDENKMLTAASLKETHESRAKLEYKAKVDAENLLTRSEPAKILVKVVNALLTGIPTDGSQTAPLASKPRLRRRRRLPMGHGRVLPSRRQRSSQRKPQKETKVFPFRSRSGLPFGQIERKRKTKKRNTSRI